MKLPDNHFYRVDSDAQTLLLWDVKRHAATALGHLCAEEHPLSWRRLGHDVKVDLCKNSSFKHDVWRLKGFRQPVLCCHAWLPSPQLESPCPEGHTWSDLWWPAGCLQGTRRRSLDGWQSRSAIGVKINQVRKGVFFKTRTKKTCFLLRNLHRQVKIKWPTAACKMYTFSAKFNVFSLDFKKIPNNKYTAVKWKDIGTFFHLLHIQSLSCVCQLILIKYCEFFWCKVWGMWILFPTFESKILIANWKHSSAAD